MTYLAELRNIVNMKQFDDSSKGRVEQIISQGKVDTLVTKKDLMSRNVYNIKAASNFDSRTLEEARRLA
jgi:hypothetical protein